MSLNVTCVCVGMYLCASVTLPTHRHQALNACRSVCCTALSHAGDDPHVQQQIPGCALRSQGQANPTGQIKDVASAGEGRVGEWGGRWGGEAGGRGGGGRGRDPLSGVAKPIKCHTDRPQRVNAGREQWRKFVVIAWIQGTVIG